MTNNQYKTKRMTLKSDTSMTFVTNLKEGEANVEVVSFQDILDGVFDERTEISSASRYRRNQHQRGSQAHGARQRR